MNKKRISMMLALSIVFANLLVVNTFAEGVSNVGAGNIDTTATNTINEGQIEYMGFIFDKSTGTISSYNGNAKIVNFPSEIDGVAVKNLCSTWEGMFSFANKQNVEKIIIPGSVEKIGQYTFDTCLKLKEVELSEGLKVIDKGAFYGSAIEKINIPSSVIEIGHNAFGYTTWEKTIMDNNNGFLIINNILYSYNGNDENVKIPDGVKNIYKDAFLGDDNVKEVTIPTSVQNVEEFDKNTDYIIHSSPAPAPATISPATSTIDENKTGFVFDKSTGTICSYKGNDSVLTIPSEIDGVPVISIDASSEMKAKGYGILGDNLTVKEIIIQGTVKSIKSGAFQNSKSLNKVQFSSGTNVIEAVAFQGCSNLSEVANLSYVSDVANDAFKDTAWQLQKDSVPIKTMDYNNVLLEVLLIIFSGTLVCKFYKHRKFQDGKL